MVFFCNCIFKECVDEQLKNGLLSKIGRVRKDMIWCSVQSEVSSFVFPFPTSSSGISGKNSWTQLLSCCPCRTGSPQSIFPSCVILFLTFLIYSHVINGMTSFYIWHLPNSHTSNSQFSSSALSAKLVWHLHWNDPAHQISNLKWLSSSSFTLLVLCVFKYWPS